MTPWLLEPPVRPSGEEARSWLREELTDPDYHERPLLEDVLDWLVRLFSEGVARAGEIAPVSTAAAVATFFALALGVLLLLGRARRDRGRRPADRAVLTDEVVTAAQLRGRAERARAEGRHEDAVVDAFRALALRQQEDARLEVAPGATAHEIAAGLGRSFPDLAVRLERCARVFEEVRYGQLPAGADRADAVLALDDDLTRRRPVEAPA